MKRRILTAGILLCILISCKQARQGKKQTTEIATGQVVEFASILLKDRITEEELLKSSSALQNDFLEKQQGFIKRVLVKKSLKEYVDIIYWESQDYADRAVENAMKNPECMAFFSIMEEADIDDPSGGLAYYEVIGSY